MIVTGLKHFTIKAAADTVDECVAFYTSVLNLRIGFRPPSAIPGFWLYAGEEPLIHLLIEGEDECLNLSCLDHIAFSCVNLPITIKRLEDLKIGYRSIYLAEVDQYLLFVRDPAGIMVELNFACEKITTYD